MKTIKKSDFYKVLISAILVEDGFNVREDLEGIEELAKSIASIGQQVPLVASKVVGEDKFLLTAGHRRFAAIKLANEKFGANIEYVNVMAGSSDEQSRTMTMLLDGNGAIPLTNQEMVKGISRLLEMGVKQKEIVSSLAMSKSQAQAYNLIAAAKAPKEIKKLLEDGVISLAKINEIQRNTNDEKEQVELAETAAAVGRKPRAKNGENSEKKKNPVIATLEAAIELSDPTSAKVATLKAIVRKLNAKASAEDIAKLLK